MSVVNDLTALFAKIAPEYPCQPLLAHLNMKFAALPAPEYQLRVSECLKFLYLRSKSGRGFIPLSHEVDEIWHEIILQTREYQRFCECLPSGEFIHHNSITVNDEAASLSNQAVVKDLLRWIPEYVAEFGPFSADAARYWMIIRLLQEDFDYTLDEINQMHG
jgi:hypothetical protein